MHNKPTDIYNFCTMSIIYKSPNAFISYYICYPVVLIYNISYTVREMYRDGGNALAWAFLICADRHRLTWWLQMAQRAKYAPTHQQSPYWNDRVVSEELHHFTSISDMLVKWWNNNIIAFLLLNPGTMPEKVWEISKSLSSIEFVFLRWKIYRTVFFYIFNINTLQTRLKNASLNSLI